MKKYILFFVIICVMYTGISYGMLGSNITDRRNYNLPLVSTLGIPIGLPPLFMQQVALANGKFYFSTNDKKIYGEIRRGYYTSEQEHYLFGYMLGTFFKNMDIQNRVAYSGKKSKVVSYVTTVLVEDPRRQDISDSFYIYFLELSLNMTDRVYCFLRVEKDYYEDVRWHILSMLSSVLDIEELPYVPLFLKKSLEIEQSIPEENKKYDFDNNSRQFLTWLQYVFQEETNSR